MESTCPHAFLPVSKHELHDEFSQTRRDSRLLERLFFYLGSAFQLIHGRVVGWLAGGTLGGADEFSQSLRHVPHRVYQHHLRRERETLSTGHNGRSIGLSVAPWGGDLTLGALSLPPSHDTSDMLEGRDRGVRMAGRERTRCASDESAIIKRTLAVQSHRRHLMKMTNIT